MLHALLFSMCSPHPRYAPQNMSLEVGRMEVYEEVYEEVGG